MNTFKNFGLHEEILEAIEELGFETPTPIQEQSIPFVLESQEDLIALAQTGTGKTAAFSLPIIQLIDTDSLHVQSIVLCPTRELCMQITKDIKNYSKHLKDFDVMSIYGGTRIDTQIRELKRGKQMVVGTPGRVLDLIRRRKLNINDIKWLVIDEADEILNMGFKEDLDAILAETPKDKQTLLFSATMPENVKKIGKKYMREAKEIRIHKGDTSLANIDHQYYMVHAKDRYKALRRIADVNPDIYGIVFCRTRRETQEVADKLIRDHYSAEALHGEISQEQRTATMNRFRNKKVQLLIATDIAARGLDVESLTHIISYNLPDSLETYIHRSGRTGRAKNNGISIVIIHTKEMNKIKILEKKIGKNFSRKNIPIGKDICEAQLFHLINKIVEIDPNDEEIEPYLAPLYEKLEAFSKEDLIKRFVSTEFSRFLVFYKDAPDLNAAVQNHNNQSQRQQRGSFEKNITFAHFTINLGANQKFGPKRLIETLIKKSALKHVKIGQIDIGQNSSYFEFDANYKNDLMKAFQNEKWKGMPIEIKPAKPSGKKHSMRKNPKPFQGKRKRGYEKNSNGSFSIGRKRRKR